MTHESAETVPFRQKPSSTAASGMRITWRARALAAALVFLAGLFPFSGGATGYSLHFAPGVNPAGGARLPVERIAGSPPSTGIDVGARDFTIEAWLRADAANAAPAIACGAGYEWVNGNIVLDRDRVLRSRTWGASLAGGRIAFGVAGPGGATITLCGQTSVADGAWHHVALQRRAQDGTLWIYVDGRLDATGPGPAGDISYPDGEHSASGCTTPCIEIEPFVFVGRRKPGFPGAGLPFSGRIDELRFSDGLRHQTDFAPLLHPSPPDTLTAGLFRFDEGSGTTLHDTAPRAGVPAHGTWLGSQPGVPAPFSTDAPFGLGVPAFSLSPLASGFVSPVEIAVPGDGTNRLFVVEQAGRVRIIELGIVLPAPFLDVSPLIVAGGERGLLGLAFHPAYAANGLFFVNYTRAPDGATVIARYQRSPSDPNLADPASAAILLVIPQDFANHNGGKLAFGPDGFLYISVGDGGSGNDPNNRAQDLTTRLGKILRIDVDGASGPSPYAVPPSNPFAGQTCATACPEIWAYGVRNPWKFTFDRLTGDLFIGDVGQNQWEEINFEPAGGAGGVNYGWRLMEGAHCNLATNPSCIVVGTLPVVEYAHDAAGGVSVTGGFRYRGSAIPPLSGWYVYGDFGSQRVWGARGTDAGNWEVANILPSPGVAGPGLISAFGEDAAGELYLANYGEGIIYRVVPRDTDADGLPDWWEGAYFPGEDALPNADPDGDGLTNLHELQRGLHPRNADRVTAVLSAILPASRSVRVGVPATAFATLLNAGTSAAYGCAISAPPGIGADFLYQTTDPLTNLVTGQPNVPADLAVGGRQTFLIALTPNVAFGPTDVALRFQCANSDVAPSVAGLNTLLLSSSVVDTPDVILIGATVSGDGILTLQPALRTGAFAVAYANVGAAAVLTVAVEPSSPDVSIDALVCRTDPSSGACLDTAQRSLALTAAANATGSLAVFVASRSPIAFDPAANRVYVRFRDKGGVVRGSTSVAIRAE